jgi:hypothetical protein
MYNFSTHPLAGGLARGISRQARRINFLASLFMENNNTNLDNSRKELEEIKKQIKRQTLGYVIAAFGLVAGLAWNEAIKSLIEYLFPLAQNTLLAKFGYAALITAVVVAVTIYLGTWLKDEKSQ